MSITAHHCEADGFCKQQIWNLPSEAALPHGGLLKSDSGEVSRVGDSHADLLVVTCPIHLSMNPDTLGVIRHPYRLRL